MVELQAEQAWQACIGSLKLTTFFKQTWWNMHNIICFGDSITRGENDDEGGGWVDRLKLFFIQQFVRTNIDEVCVFNLGIGGETTNGLMRRFKTELDSRRSEFGHDVVILAYGANDLAKVGDENLVPVNQYVSNLMACIDYAKSTQVRVCLLEILPVSRALDGTVNELGKLRTNSEVGKYNLRLRQLAATLAVELIPLNSSFSEEKEALLTTDGVHPNPAGHAFLFDAVRPRVVALLAKN